MNYKKYIVGSTPFFNVYDDFKSKDIDYLVITENPTDFKVMRQIHFPDKCIFEWERMPKEDFIDLAINRKCHMETGKFLVPDVIEDLGITIDDLKLMKNSFDNMDEKHLYEKIIYDSYIENNDFVLTQEQRDKAYELYKKYRQEK